MNYIIIICISVIMLHFILYYLNIDPFELSNNTKQHIIDTPINAIDSNYIIINKPINIDIEASINELKKLNEYIDNECGHN